MSDYIEILLSKTSKTHAGKYVAKVSQEDAILDEINWTVVLDTRGGRHTQYAFRTLYKNGEQSKARLHRVVMERMLERSLESHEFVDHINGNGLDNRRENLRLATMSQNQANRRIKSNSRNKYKGIQLREGNRWHARISVNGQQIHLGYFDTAEQAHIAYCEAAIKYHGEFANFGDTTA